jgi:glycine hydroxymethyltransferase
MTTIEELLERHDKDRLNAINLIVSENRMSARARQPLSSDIHSRYAAEFYAGTDAARELVSTVTESARQVFSSAYANLAPVSGNMCLLAVMFALTDTGDSVGRVPPFFPGGGYPFNYAAFDRRPLPLPFSATRWQLDLEQTVALLQRDRPPLVVLGSSIVTYPMPVREVSNIVHDYGGLVAYDGSHSLGLIAGGQYQDPLGEGADLLFGSTHKTFPGPQGGLILTNDEAVHRRVEALANFRPLNGPTLVCNPHLARIAATGIVLEETKWKEYAYQVVSNAQTIARVLHDEGIPLHGTAGTGYPELTYCHQVVTGYETRESSRLRNVLADHRIYVDGFCRIGTSEITRLGYRTSESAELGRVLARLLRNSDDANELEVSALIQSLIESHRSVIL